MAGRKANLLAAIHHAGPDHVPCWGEGAWAFLDHATRQPPLAGIDEWGVTWAPLPEGYRPGVDEPARSHPVGHPARTATELLAHPFPAVPTAILAASRPAPSDALWIGRHGPGPLDRLVTLLGAEAAYTALVAEPEACAAALAQIAEHEMGVARLYLAAGAEAGWLADDYAGATGPLLAPALWRRLILPAAARIIAAYRQAGALVFFHTCGRAEAFVGDLLDAGATVFNLESHLSDLPALRARYGRRIAFFGGVPTGVMQAGAPADVQRAARRAIAALGAGGGLILAPDQPLAYPAANERALQEVTSCPKFVETP